MTRITVTLAVMTLACSTPGPKDPGHNRPLSVQEHEAEAQRHEREAAGHKAMTSPEETSAKREPTCFDQPMAPDPTSGGETIRIMRPCWTAVANGTSRHQKLAALHLKAAREHRSKAADLLGTEKRACAGLGEKAISISPFFYREDVQSVEPYKEKGKLLGARVVFRPVKGLDAAWMERSMRCHQARAAVMGYSTTYMKYCPLMVGELDVRVEAQGENIAVTMRTKNEVVANAVLGRANDLTGGE